jgi:hypothetical protein
MRGSKSASDDPARWTRVRVEERGGFAGLCRGATLARDAAAPERARRIGQLLGTLQAGAPGAPPDPLQPDAQTLVLEVHTAHGRWQRAFNTADLPDGVTELLSCLPDLGPLPPG